MKKLFVILAVTLISLSSYAQKENIDYPNGDSVLCNSDFLSFHTSVLFAQNWFGRNSFTTNYGFDYVKSLSNKTTLFLGANIMNSDANLRDLSPRKTKTYAQTYFGMEYNVNDKLSIGGSVFYDSFFETVGADVDVLYRFSENSYINIYAMFSKSLDNGYRIRPEF
ncbi:MAG: hypothetical protein IJ748_04170 [Bacteroidales bacterium]|nr:hypothetical protein [Bacteroidales bacterium]